MPGLSNGVNFSVCLSVTLILKKKLVFITDSDKLPILKNYLIFLSEVFIIF